MIRSTLAAISIVVVAAGCGGAESSRAPTKAQSGTQSHAPADTGNAAEVTDGFVAEATPLTDKKGDLVDQDGKPAKRYPPIDIRKLEARADGEDLHLTLTVAGDIPEQYSSIRQELNYLFVIEPDNSGEGDYWILVGNLEAGDWSTDLSDWVTSQTHAGERFPGAGSIVGNRVQVSVSLAALGDPDHLRISVITQRADHETGDVLGEDQVPAG